MELNDLLDDADKDKDKGKDKEQDEDHDQAAAWARDEWVEEVALQVWEAFQTYVTHPSNVDKHECSECEAVWRKRC